MSDQASRHGQWARLRFSVIGPLFASPPPPGELAEQLAMLAKRTYRHPINGTDVHFAVSTLERWYYQARSSDDPVAALGRRIRKNIGQQPCVSVELVEAMREQYSKYPNWSYKLHYDNLVAQLGRDGAIPLPSYPTIRRAMKARGMVKQKLRRPRSQAEEQPQQRPPRETRSYEVCYVHGLWHLDFHQGSRRLLLQNGKWATALLFGCLDDRSRLCCHAQWYLAESTETLVHGLSQAILKRGLPRALLTDNGSAMLAAETVEGLERLGIVHYTTLPYHAEQNGKQENFWTRIEGRLLPMMQDKKEVDLNFLNLATSAWVEQEYHRSVHGELKQTPLDAFIGVQSVGRPSPSPASLRQAFRMQLGRTQRRSDGTVSVYNTRFELPSAFRTLQRPTVRVARWDLSSIDLVDPRTSVTLATLLPLDKQKNADRKRRVVAEQTHAQPEVVSRSDTIAPLLQQYLADHAETGLPPAYVPHRHQTEIQPANQPNTDKQKDDHDT